MLVLIGGPILTLRGREREMAPASSFVPRGVSPSMLPLWDMLQDEQITSPLCAPGSLQVTVSTLCSWAV